MSFSEGTLEYGLVGSSVVCKLYCRGRCGRSRCDSRKPGSGLVEILQSRHGSTGTTSEKRTKISRSPVGYGMEPDESHVSHDLTDSILRSLHIFEILAGPHNFDRHSVKTCSSLRAPFSVDELIKPGYTFIVKTSDEFEKNITVVCAVCQKN